MSGPRPKPSMLRLIGGETHKERIHDDKPKVSGEPVVPPGVALSVAESAIWKHLMEHVYQPGVHGTGDGLAFVMVCRLSARVNEIDEQIRLHGLTVGATKISAHARLSRDTWRQLDGALAAIGATPSGRYRLNGRRRENDGGGDWGSID